MRVVLAPYSFKDCLSSVQVGLAMEKGIKRVDPEIEVIKVPIADGGEGSADTFISATGGRIIKTLVQDPLGRLITGSFGISGDTSTAIIEMAAASGEGLLAENERNPLKTSTYGTGQLIAAALDEGVKRIVICTGGCATVDGGLGMAKALGIRFLNANGFELGEGGQELNLLAKIDMSGIDPRVRETEFIVACDTSIAMTGAEGASFVYGSQKGANSPIIEQLEQGLTNLVKVIETELSIDLQNFPSAGVAGGLGGAVVAFLNGRLMSGIKLMIEAINLKERLQNVNLLFTGGGRLEYQSDVAMAFSNIGEIARETGIPTIAITGSWGHDYDEVIYDTGISGIAPISATPTSSMNEITQSIINTTARTFRILLTGVKAGIS